MRKDMLLGILLLVASVATAQVVYQIREGTATPTTKTYYPTIPRTAYSAGVDNSGNTVLSRMTPDGASVVNTKVSNTATTTYMSITGPASITPITGRREVLITVLSDDADDVLWVNVGSTSAVINQCLKITDNLQLDVTEDVTIGLNASTTFSIAITQLGIQ